MDDRQKNPKRFPSITSLNTILLFMFFIFLALFLCAAFIFKQQPKKQLTNIIPQQISPTPADTISSQSAIKKLTPTSNKFTNHVYNFSITYPNNFIISESSFSTTIERVEFWQKKPGSTDQADYQMLLFPKTVAAAAGQNFDAFYTLQPGIQKTIKDSSGATIQFTKIHNQKLNNNRSFTYNTKSLPLDVKEEPEYGYYIEAGPNLIMISARESKRSALDIMTGTIAFPAE
jgi:hypothetical protein